MIITVNVRWWDGYLESFEASEVRFGSDLLWMRLVDGKNRHIPLRGVRWYSTLPESHELQPQAEGREGEGGELEIVPGQFASILHGLYGCE